MHLTLIDPTDYTQGGGVKFPPRRISGSRQDSNDISTATSLFSGSRNPMVLLWILPVVAGSGKSKMAAFKPDILISQLQDKIATKFQRLTLHFQGPATQWDWLEYCATKPEVKNPIWRPTNRIYLYLSSNTR